MDRLRNECCYWAGLALLTAACWWLGELWEAGVLTMPLRTVAQPVASPPAPDARVDGWLDRWEDLEDSEWDDPVDAPEEIIFCPQSGDE